MHHTPPPLRVAHTESSLGWGGQEIRILTEAAGMLARGHEVILLTPPEAPIFAEARLHGVPACPLPIARRAPRALLALRRWLRDNPVDLVNTHSSTDSWLAAAARLTLAAPPPQVRTRHISAPISQGRASRWLYTRATQYIVTTGEALRLDLIHRNGFPPERITSVPTGIDLARFDPDRTPSSLRAELGIPAGAPLLAIVATLRSWKGHVHLLDAFARLKPRWPDLGLVIVGDGPQWQALQDRVQGEGLKGAYLLGRRRDIPQILAGCDLFVLPSTANEGVPQAILQAMAMGLAVVSTPVGAIPEAVLDGQTGLLVPPADPEALARALDPLLGDPERRAAMGQAGRRRIQALFSLDGMLDRMEQIFRAVSLARRRFG